MKRKSLLFFLLIALFAPLAMNGQQTLSVADQGGTTSDSHIPFEGLYADDNYQHTQTIYPSTMLTQMQGGTITKLTYYLKTAITTNLTSTFEVRLGTTTQTSFSSGTVNYISMTGSANYTGTIDVTNSSKEVTITLATPYTYNSGNLVVDVRLVNHTTGYKTTDFLGETGSTYYSVYSRTSSSQPPFTQGSGASFMPKTTFTYLSTDPYISLAPAAATVFTGFTQTLTATYGNVSGTPTITYSSSNTNVATVSGSGTTATVTGVAPGTATITATMNGSYTATCTITVENPSYCTPSYSQTSDYIKSFVTTGGTTNISNTNTGQGTGGYSDFYNSHSASIDAGETLSFTVTRGYSDSYKYAIWVDWNHDYVFDVTTETVAQQTTSVNSDWSSSFTIPANTAAGDYRMRVEMLYGSSATLNPCVSASYGEVEDYKLTVLAASNCPKPTGLTATNLMPNSATLNWEGEAESYNVRYRTAASSGETTTFSEDFENGIPATWTTIDGDDDGNNWLALSEVSTVYTSYSGTMSDWAHSGNNAATSPSFANSVGCFDSDQWLITPQVNLGGTLKFYAASTYSDLDAFEVLLSTSGTAISDFTTTLQTMHDAPYALNDGTDDWEEVTIDLSSYSGQGYIAIHHVSNCMYFLVIDDFAIYANEPAGEWLPNATGASTSDNSLPITGLTPETTYEFQVQADCGTDGESNWSNIATFTTPDACAVPTGLTAEVTGNAAELSWTGTTDTYNVQYREVDPTVPATIILNVPTDIWNDGSGYQLVLDADHNTYGTTIPTSGNFTAGTFADFEYTIPENAVCSTTTNTIVINGSVSITIPAGVYDYVFLNPDPNGTTYYIASSNGFSSRGDDYEFQAGKTYEFTLSIVGSNDYITPTITDNGNAWTTVNGVTNPYMLENLSSQTTYEYQVQGVNCDGNGGTTDWSASATFTTGEFYVKPITGYGTGAGCYYLIASPIGDVAPTAVTNMINSNHTGYDLFYFDQSRDMEWVNYKPVGTDLFDPEFDLVAGKGYLYANKQNVTLVFTGQAHNTENMEIELNLTETASGYTIDLPGWNLVGNPYAELAYIDIVSEERPFYTMNGGGTAFEAVTGGSIDPMEGIFVVAEEDGETMTFTTTEPTSKGKGLALNLSDSHNRIDRAIVRFNKGRTLPKLMLFENSSKIYIPVDGKDYAVVRSEEVGEMPVNFKAENNGSYTLSLSVDNVEFGYLHLIDNMTGMDIDLLQTPSYSFEAKTTDYESRFKLVFATGDNSNSDTFAFFSNGSFVINNEGNATLQVIDVTGRILKSESINGCANVSVNAAPGVYMLRLVNGDNVKVQKVVVR